MAPRPPAGRHGVLIHSLGHLLLVLCLLALVLVLAGCDEAGVPSGGGMTPATTQAPIPTEPATAEPTLAPTPEPTPTPARAVDLRKAVAAGEIAVTGTGDGLQRLDVRIRSKAREPLRVVVNPGTVFDAGRSSTQAMVVVAKAIVPIEPGATESVTLDVACSEMHKDQPGSNDSFKLVKRSLPKDLTALLALEGFPAADFRVQQFAIWTILDDPTRDGFVRLGTFGVGSGPSSKEISADPEALRGSGDRPDAYRATR